MSLILIRQKARQLQSRRHRRVVGSAAGPLIVAVFYIFGAKYFPHAGGMFDALFAVVLVWSIVGVFFFNRARHVQEMPSDAAFRTSLEFCRQEVERQLGQFPDLVVWQFGPMIAAIGMFIAMMALSTPIFPKAIPLLAAVGVWVPAYLFIGARQQRELRQELEALNQIDRENG